MMKMLLSLIIIILTLIMFFLNHPLSMGLMILMQTLLICMLSGMMIKTYWFTYILFLTFLGGMLVLFIYISSIASNELIKFSMSMNNILLLLILMMFILLINVIFYKLIWKMNFNFNSDMEYFFNNFLFFNNENNFNLSKLYNNQTFILMMMMIIYLFITLIVVVKITNIFYGPLRSF